MAIFEVTQESILALEETTFAARGIKERQDIQRLLRKNISAISQGLYVIAEEYGEWEDARRRIDLLCIDRDANLVVVEIKRTDDGGHMELQAIRYAAMVSRMTFGQAVTAHASYLREIGGTEDDARSSMLSFLRWDEVQEAEFAKQVRIILISAEFSKEITTAAMWLSEYGVDITCVRLRPYASAGRTFIDIEQILPLQEAAAYQVQWKKKAAEEREAKESGADWTRYDLHVGQQVFRALLKRHLFLHTFKALVEAGVPPQDIARHFPEGKFLVVPGRFDSQEFLEKAATLKTPTGKTFPLQRFFTQDEMLLVSDSQTYAVSKMWSKGWLPALDALLTEYSGLGIRYEEAATDE